jgi:hypothetical protein
MMDTLMRIERFEVIEAWQLGRELTHEVYARKVTLNGELPGPDLTLRCSTI